MELGARVRQPTIYRITHLWPNKQPGHGSTTAQIEKETRVFRGLGRNAQGVRHAAQESGPEVCRGEVVELIPAPDSSTVQIKPETDEPNALPSRFVSLQDYEALEREAK